MTETEFTRQITGMRSALYSLTKRFTKDREDCLDLVQDTMLKALIYRDKFREDTNLKGWLFTIMKNTFINNYRKNKRNQAMTDVTKEKFFLQAEDEHSFNKPQERMQFKEIWMNVEYIKEDLVMPFKMHLSGYKYHEIAEQLQVPIGTVKNRIFHARKEIQKKLHGYS